MFFTNPLYLICLWPLFVCRELTANDKCIIIASDGVFEFLTNQMIADIVARYDDPLQACKAVTSAAYDMWLQYEVRTDDITIIALFVDDFRVSSSRRVSNYSSTSSFFVPTNVDRKNQIATAESRPVRRVISREKRKNMIQLTDDYDEIVQFSEDVNDHIPKNPEEVATIATTIKHNFLFQHLTASQRSSVINLMIPVQVKAGDWIIRQGDKGDRFYVIDSGKFEVRVKPTKITGRLSISSQGRFRTSESDICYTEVEITPEFLAMEQEEKDLELAASNVVHVYESGPDQHPGFGELSLMLVHNAPYFIVILNFFSVF